MVAGLQLLGAGALLVLSLLLRNAAARHVSPGMVPGCLQGRLLQRNRWSHPAMALATAVLLGGLALLVASQIATSL